MQLNKYLALCGVASRRKSNEAITNGLVSLNGEVVTQLGVVVDPEIDIICYHGKRLVQPFKYRYILLNKPANVLTTAKDGRGRRTVLDVVKVPERIFPVGRLDYDTTGVLLLTNDGDLAYRLAHPKYEIDKIYQARVQGQMDLNAVQKLKTGVWVEEMGLMQGDARILSASKKQSSVEIRIHEGKKRQVKQMLKAVGYPVISLERLNFAGITVGNLPRGGWRELRPEEVKALYQLTGIKTSYSGNENAK